MLKTVLEMNENTVLIKWKLAMENSKGLDNLYNLYSSLYL